MGVTDKAICIHHADQRHTTQPKEPHFLPIAPGDGVVRIGQADERNAMRLPVQAEGLSVIGSNSHDLHAATPEVDIVITPARQLRATEGSEEAAQEGQHERSAAIIGEADALRVHVFEFEIRRLRAGLKQIRHRATTPWP